MKLSAKSRYGLSACIALAKHFDDGNMSVSQLCQHVDATEKFLEQVMSLLKKAGVVSSTRGAFGGYVLTNTPQQTTVGQILRALEDNLQMVSCVGGEVDCENKCSSFVVWNKLYQNINEFLDSMTLSSLI